MNNSPKHYSFIASTKVKVSQALVAQNRLPEAENIAREAYDEVKQNLSEQHPALKTAAANLVKIYEREGKHDLAAELK